jgi:dihydropteroate synthase
VLDFFICKKDELHKAGITDIIIDPGFGFGKTIAHNFELLRHLPVFNMLDRPLILGISRKSTVYKTLGITAEEALNGTTVLNTIGLMNGASILRVHDVKEAVEAVKLYKRIRQFLKMKKSDLLRSLSLHHNFLIMALTKQSSIDNSQVTDLLWQKQKVR